jgi:two-component sensor histidine kinase
MIDGTLDQRILVVDDEEMNLELIGEILKHHGYSYETAQNGAEALEKAREFKPDLVLLDVMMPRMDGYEVCRKLKRDLLTENIPVVMITSLTDRESRLKGLEAGANDFISKPVDTTELMIRTKNLLKIKEYEDFIKSYNKWLQEEVDSKTAQIKKILNEKILLVQELHHRVKNNMSVISSLLGLQSMYVKDEDDRILFKESQSRIRSMSLVHSRLYESRDLTNVEFKGYVESLLNQLIHIYAVNRDQIRITTKLKKVSLSIDYAIPCGVILNELISNAFKHAFPSGRTGEINIELTSCAEDKVMLIVSDNGIGMLGGIDVHNPKTFGLCIVNVLADQLEGKLEVSSKGGTSFGIVFPTSQYAKRI